MQQQVQTQALLPELAGAGSQTAWHPGTKLLPTPLTTGGTRAYRNITGVPSQITFIVQGAYQQLQNQITAIVSYGLALLNLTSDLQRLKIKPKTPS